MGSRATTEMGHFHVFDDITNGLGGDLRILGGKLFHTLGIGNETFGGLLDSFFQAIHQRPQCACFVHISKERDETKVEVELEHWLGKIESLRVGDVTKAFRPEHHAAHGLTSDDTRSLFI